MPPDIDITNGITVHMCYPAQHLKGQERDHPLAIRKPILGSDSRETSTWINKIHVFNTHSDRPLAITHISH